ncbi:MAG: protein kinase [Acidobacteria bacterium]|nr:protein kinase [Acidobacteriota bacterium]
MTPELYRQIGNLYHAALELEPSQRKAFLDEACAGNEELRQEVEGLLASNEQAGNFLAAPAVETVSQPSSINQSEKLIGQVLGQYRVLSRIGAGGMGEVFLAEDNRLNRKVALKILPAEFVSSPDRIRRFEREAKAASATAHPNIVSIYDIGQHQGIHYIASEYVEGETLRRRIKREPLSQLDALDIAIQIANALDSAHAAGIVHRDIKPENIMLRPDGFVKVLDFGLAAVTHPTTPSSDSEDQSFATSTDTLPGTVMGTVAYMSPEQTRGQKADKRSDLWSLGVVLFEMLAGKTPFKGQTVPDTLVAILDRPPAKLESGSPDLERIILKLLAKDREQRYQTAKKLAADLKLLKRRLEFESDSHNFQAFTENKHSSETPEQSAETSFLPPSSSSPVSQELRLSDLLTGQQTLVVGKRTKWVLAAMVILLAALAVSAYWMIRNDDVIESIAILPLVNQNNDPNLEYITDGVTETLIGNLSKLPRLKVMSRTTVFRYKKQEVDPIELGKTLNVEALLTGRLEKRDQTLVITVELVSTRDNSRLWGDVFPHKMSDLLAAQAVISERVSERLRTKLTGEERQQVTKRYTENPEAYRFYLNGRFEWNRQSIEGFRKAIEFYRQAIALDQNYALAYSGLADVYATLAANGLATPEIADLARFNAEQAVRLDDNLPEAHLSLGTVNFFGWNLPVAETELKRAIALNPNLAEAYSRQSAVLQGLDRYDEAIRAGQLALEFDPYSLRVHLDLYFAYFYAGLYDRAIEVCRKMLQIETRYFPAHLDLGRAYVQKNMLDQAIAELLKARELSNDEPLVLAALGHAYAVAGRTGEAQTILEKLLQLAQTGNVRPYEIAKVYAGLGDKDRAFEWLNKALQDRSPWLLKLKAEPNFENLRTDQRFQTLVQQIRPPQ